MDIMKRAVRARERERQKQRQRAERKAYLLEHGMKEILGERSNCLLGLSFLSFLFWGILRSGIFTLSEEDSVLQQGVCYLLLPFYVGRGS